MVDHKISYFDIKLNSPHKDLIVIKGNDNECDPILLEGRVKLSINENIHVKKIKLRLIGELSVSYCERNSAGEAVQHVLEKLTVLMVNWDNLLIDDEGDILIGNYGDKPIKSYKAAKIHGHAHSHSRDKNDRSTLERPNFDRTKSQPHLGKPHKKDNPTIKIPTSGIDGTPFKNSASHNSFLLPKGNYSLPFKIVLPTTTCETVEGLAIGKMLYRFEGSIHKGMLFDKPIIKSRYMRIIRTLHPNSLNLLDNIDINNTWPQKVDYKVLLNKKGVAIGSTIPIKVLIVPLVKRLKLKKIMTEIVQHYHVNYIDGVSPEYEQIFGSQQVKGELDDDILTQDYWEFTCHYKVPDSIKEVTQTCTLNNDLILVGHKIRVIIQIKNPEGHVSELRANLPITLYISSNIGHVYGHRFDIDNHYGTFNIIKGQNDALFKRDKVNSLVSPLVSPQETPTVTPRVSPSLLPTTIDDNLEEEEEDELETIMAPPMYEASKNDKIFDITSAKSPIEQLGTSYFDLPRSSTSQGNEMSISPRLDLNMLSKVPSYFEAVEEDDDANDFAPSYDDGNSSLSSSFDHSMTIPQPSPYKLDKNHSSSSLSHSLSQSFKSSSTPSHSRSSSNLKLQLKFNRKK